MLSRPTAVLILPKNRTVQPDNPSRREPRMPAPMMLPIEMGVRVRIGFGCWASGKLGDRGGPGEAGAVGDGVATRIGFGGVEMNGVAVSGSCCEAEGNGSNPLRMTVRSHQGHAGRWFA